jgi:putative membrane protein
MTKVCVLIFFTILIWSGLNPKDQYTWFLEVFPAIIGFTIILFSYKTFKFTTLTYTLILLHCIILMVGGHYTYAQVPLFDTIKELLNQDRNNYDKVGHFFQGFVPAIITREILIRKNIIPSANWRNFFIVCFCLALSSFYEIMEWVIALFSKESAEAFLGTQGYVWDTQSDMGLALVGSIVALILLSKYHDKQLAKLNLSIH